MARFSVGRDEDGDDHHHGTTSRINRPLPKRPRSGNPTPITPIARNGAASTSVPRAAPAVVPISVHERSESDTSSSHSSFDSKPEEEQELEEVGEEDEVQPAEARRVNDVTLSDTDVLDCPICFDPLSPPVYQCENGHLACGLCCNKIRNKCPTCSMPIGYNRCRGMEKVLESVKTSCQNWELGCMEKLSYCKKLDHEKSCKYTACSCPNTGCNYIGAYKSLYVHFSAEHSYLSGNFRLDTTRPIVLHKDEKHFFLQERSENTLFVLNNVIERLGNLAHVICLAPTSSAAKFSFELTAKNGEKLIKLISSVELMPKLTAQSPKKNCLLITNDFADRFQQLNLELIIRKVS